MNRTQTELENALDATPENMELWSVYADCLQNQGDVHGEIIALGVALFKDQENQTARNQLHKHIETYRETLAKGIQNIQIRPITWDDKTGTPGSLAWKFILSPSGLEHESRKYTEIKLELVHGYIRNLEITSRKNGLLFPEELFRRILYSSPARFLTKLSIHRFDSSEISDIDRDVGSGTNKALRNISLLNTNLPNTFGDVRNILKLHPELIELEICDWNLQLRAVSHKKLEQLTLTSIGEFHARYLENLTACEFPNLKGLHLHIFNRELEWLSFLFENLAFPNLKELSFREYFGKSVIEQIQKWPFLPELETLRIQSHDLNDEVAELILEKQESFQHLKRISLNTTNMGSDLVQQLKDIFGAESFSEE